VREKRFPILLSLSLLPFWPSKNRLRRAWFTHDRGLQRHPSNRWHWRRLGMFSWWSVGGKEEFCPSCDSKLWIVTWSVQWNSDGKEANLQTVCLF